MLGTRVLRLENGKIVRDSIGDYEQDETKNQTTTHLTQTTERDDTERGSRIKLTAIQ